MAGAEAGSGRGVGQSRGLAWSLRALSRGAEGPSYFLKRGCCICDAEKVARGAAGR